MGGPLGAIGGAALGHILFDRQHGESGAGAQARPGGGFAGREQAQAAYFVALFSILGKLAKADGTVSKEEGEAFKDLLSRLRLNEQQRDFAIRIFNESKSSSYSIEDFARQYQQLSGGRIEVLTQMIDMLYFIAAADGHLAPQEEEAIKSVAGIFRLSDTQVSGIKARYFTETNKYYKVLGLDPNCSDEELRSAYRDLVRQYHPDTVVSKGLPDEFVDFAKKRFQEIQEAYENIKKERNLS